MSVTMEVSARTIPGQFSVHICHVITMRASKASASHPLTRMRCSSLNINTTYYYYYYADVATRNGLRMT